MSEINYLNIDGELSTTPIGYDNLLSKLENFNLSDNLSNAEQNYQASSIASGQYDFGTGGTTIVGGTIGGVSISDIVNVTSPIADITPTGLTATATGIKIASNGTISAYVTLTWNVIDTGTFSHYQIRYKKSDYYYYQYMEVDTNTITIDGLTPNVPYNFSICSVTKASIKSLWSANVSKTTATNTSPPATVASVSATAGIQYVIVEWDNNSEADIASYNIYRHTSDASGSASLIANVRTNYFVDSALAIDTYYYWLKAVNTSGILSTNFSTVASATPRNIVTGDIGEGQITPPLTDIPAINPVDGEINENAVGTLQLDDNAVEEANILDGAITAAKTSIAAINPVDGEINANKIGTLQLDDNAVTNAEILDDAVNAAKLAVAAIDGTTGDIVADHIVANMLQTDCVISDKILAGSVTANKLTVYNFMLSAGSFSNNSPSAGKISWTGCKVVYNGTEYDIDNDDCLTTDKHIYWQLASPTVFSASDTLPALGNNDFLVAFNNTGTALYVWNSTIVNGNRITSGSITATNIAANTITANEIAAGTITAVEILAGTITANRLQTFNFLMSEGSFSNDDPDPNKISWADVKVVYNGVEYEIDDDDCLTTDKHIYWQLASPTVFSASDTLPALGNDDFIVAFNDDGTAIYVWNSTIINGNRITTGSIVATNMAANSITTNAIEAGAVLANKITSNSFAFSAGSFTGDDPTAGKISWAGCKIVYQGTEYEITDGDCDIESVEKHIYWELASPTIFQTSLVLPTLSNNGFLVAYNDAGTPKYVWNSTIINGNRISTGTVTTDQIAANTINSNNIDGTLGISASKILMDGVVYLSNWQKAGDLTMIDGGSISTGSVTTTQLNFTPVQGTDVIASINASAEGIQIEADNLRIGNTTNYWDIQTATKVLLTATSADNDVAINYGKTDFGDDSTSGFILGYDYSSSVSKFEMGSSATKIFRYDGTDISLIGGSITGGSIAIGTSNNIFKADSNGIYLGNATFASAPFRVTPVGALYASSAEISGKLITGAGSSINGTYLDSLDADKINAGTLTGFTIQTSASANTGIKMSATIGGMDVYGQHMAFKDTSGNLFGYVYGSGSFNIAASGGRNLVLSAGNYLYFNPTGNFVLPSNDNDLYLGGSTTSSGGSLANDYTWKYVGAQIIDAKDKYKLNNYDVIDQSGTTMYIKSGGAGGLVLQDGSTTIATFSSAGGLDIAAGKDLDSQYAHLDCVVFGDNSPLTENGTIYFNGTHFYGRIAGAWKQLDN